MLIDTLRTDLTASMKSGNSSRVETLRFLISAIKNFEIDKYPPSSNQSLTDDDVLSVIAKQVKTHRESIDMFQKAGRTDLVEKETHQLTILEEFLPKQLSEEEVKTTVREIKAKMMQEGKEVNFGMFMSEVMKVLRGKADGSVVSRFVKEELG
jgi:uncharacterized protein